MHMFLEYHIFAYVVIRQLKSGEKNIFLNFFFNCILSILN